MVATLCAVLDRMDPSNSSENDDDFVPFSGIAHVFGTGQVVGSPEEKQRRVQFCRDVAAA